MLDNYCGKCTHGKGTFNVYSFKQHLCDSTGYGHKFLGFIHTAMFENHPESMKKKTKNNRKRKIILPLIQ